MLVLLNDVTNLISLVYAKIGTELLGPIWPGAVYDENKIGQQRNQSYKCDLR